jgi:GH15 family glucan-1,4-alpha-glucosidase
MDNYKYGMVGNCRSAALISEKGSIDWWCLPEFDSSSVFGALLDEDKGGRIEIITEEAYQTNQSYQADTNILCTYFSDGNNSFEILDFMPRYKTENGGYFTPPETCRLFRVISGKPKIRIRYDPHLNYAMGETKHIITGKYIKSYCEYPEYESIYLYASFPLKDILDQQEITLHDIGYMLISYNQKLMDINNSQIYLEYQRTKVYWLNWVSKSRKFDLYNNEITRSLLILKLLTYQRTGAILAAATTSLPEELGKKRNWDYRFCWIRDASMTLETLVELGHFNAAKRYMTFIKNVIILKSESFQIMYGIRGERDLEEKTLDYLKGYQGSKPVRIGNAAYRQSQHDISGFLLDLIYLYFLHFAGTQDESEDIWSITRSMVRTVSANWQKPDHGIWEIRGEKKQYVFSKIHCWVAVDRAVKIARLLNQKQYLEEWEKLAVKIRNDILLKGWNQRKKTFTQVYGEESLDASLLLMEAYGFLSAADEKYRSTVLAIKKELYHDGLMYRYNSPDELGYPVSSFTVCNFWLIGSLYKIGFQDEARKIFNNLLGLSNHLGLFSEDIDFKTKRQLGNFPQAYSHIALVKVAMIFSREKPSPVFLKP